MTVISVIKIINVCSSDLTLNAMGFLLLMVYSKKIVTSSCGLKFVRVSDKIVTVF